MNNRLQAFAVKTIARQSRAAACNRRALVSLILCGFPTVGLAQQPELIVEVDRQQVYLGESIIYNVTVNHVEDPSRPKLEGFDAFNVAFQGEQSLNSQQITIVNGRRSEVIRQGKLYQYRLTPTSAGTLSIPAPTTEVNGNAISGRAVAIEVIEPQDQELVILESSVSKTAVYPLQPFTLSLTIAVRQLPEKIADRSPLSIQSRSPVQLNVPWLDDQRIPDGLVAAKSWRQILEPLVSGSTQRQFDGMQINEIGSQSAFSFFERDRKTVFLPSSTRTIRRVDDGTETGYVEYHLERTFVPQQIGTFHFAGATMKGTFGTEFSDGKLTGKDIYAVSSPLTIAVKDVPGDGRPDSYIGAIGTFDVSATLLPEAASVGTPLTLTLTVFGQGTIADIRPPDVASLPQMAEQFRTYDATAKTVNNGRVFTYSLRALSESVTVFPAIPVAYFDVEREEYVTLATDPIPLVITAAKQLATSDIVASQPQRSNGTGLEVNDAGLFANHTSLQTLRATNMSTTHWLTTWATMIVGYCALSFGLQRRRRLHADPALRKRKNARQRAVESLRAVRAAAGDLQNVSVDALSKIVGGLIADFTGAAEAGMTSVDAAKVLGEVDCDEALRDRVTRFMDAGDAARFSADAVNSSALTEECEALIADLSQELGKRC